MGNKKNYSMQKNLQLKIKEEEKEENRAEAQPSTSTNEKPPKNPENPIYTKILKSPFAQGVASTPEKVYKIQPRPQSPTRANPEPQSSKKQEYASPKKSYTDSPASKGAIPKILAKASKHQEPRPPRRGEYFTPRPQHWTYQGKNWTYPGKNWTYPGKNWTYPGKKHEYRSYGRKSKRNAHMSWQFKQRYSTPPGSRHGSHIIGNLPPYDDFSHAIDLPFPYYGSKPTEHYNINFQAPYKSYSKAVRAQYFQNKEYEMPITTMDSYQLEKAIIRRPPKHSRRKSTTGTVPKPEPASTDDDDNLETIYCPSSFNTTSTMSSTTTTTSTVITPLFNTPTNYAPPPYGFRSNYNVITTIGQPLQYENGTHPNGTVPIYQLRGNHPNMQQPPLQYMLPHNTQFISSFRMPYPPPPLQPLPPCEGANTTNVSNFPGAYRNQTEYQTCYVNAPPPVQYVNGPQITNTTTIRGPHNSPLPPQFRADVANTPAVPLNQGDENVYSNTSGMRFPYRSISEAELPFQPRSIIPDFNYLLGEINCRPFQSLRAICTHYGALFPPVPFLPCCNEVYRHACPKCKYCIEFVRGIIAELNKSHSLLTGGIKWANMNDIVRNKVYITTITNVLTNRMSMLSRLYCKAKDGIENQQWFTEIQMALVKFLLEQDRTHHTNDHNPILFAILASRVGCMTICERLSLSMFDIAHAYSQSEMPVHAAPPPLQQQTYFYQNVRPPNPQPQNYNTYVRAPGNYNMNLNPPQNYNMNLNPPQNCNMNLNPPQNRSMNLNSPQNCNMNVNPPQNYNMNVIPPQNYNMNLNPLPNCNMNVSSPQNCNMNVNPPQNCNMNVNPPQNCNMNMNPPQNCNMIVNPLPNCTMNVNPPPNCNMNLNQPQNCNMNLHPPQNCNMNLNPSPNCNMNLNPPLNYNMNYQLQNYNMNLNPPATYNNNLNPPQNYVNVNPPQNYNAHFPPQNYNTCLNRPPNPNNIYFDPTKAYYPRYVIAGNQRFPVNVAPPSTSQNQILPNESIVDAFKERMNLSEPGNR